MNDIVEEGHWKRMREIMQEREDGYAINTMDRTDGKLARGLQEKYGTSQDKATKKLERRLRDDDQRQIASALRARRTNKHQSIGW